MMEPILAYYDLDAEVTAFSTTRHGGYSEGSYSSFNINNYCGDNLYAISRNKELLCRKLSIRPNDVVMPHQNHCAAVKLIDDSFFNRSGEEKDVYLNNVDALVTKKRGICIGVSTADCIPVLIYDTFHHAAAAVHSGWRGTVARIVKITLQKMNHYFMTGPEDVKVIIGPGISKEFFEVDEDVYNAFCKAGFDMKSISTEVGLKWHVDLPKAIAVTLMENGVKEERINDTKICTYKNYKDFFSARHLTIHCGRIFSGVILR